MNRFRSSRFCTLAIAAMVAIASTAFFVFDRVATACTAVYQVAREFVASVPAKFAEPALKLAARPVEILQACAYALRLAKRDRPRLTPGWRMCPST
jgi:hypothetical protein